VSASGATVHDVTTGLEWQRAAPEGSFTLVQAKEYASQLALDGGGWRLPTVGELSGIVDLSRMGPAIDTEAFPNTPPGWFWSATPYAGGEGRACVVFFDGGYAYYGHGGYDSAVRCVR
jgi:hypothetical protein